MKYTGGPVTVLLERAEERGAVARRHTLQDRQVKLEHAFASVKHPAEVLAQPPGYFLHLDFGHEVQVEFGPQPRQGNREDPRAFLGRLVIRQLVRNPGIDELRQSRQVPGGLVRKTSPDHDRLQVDIQPRRDERLVAAGHHHELVDEFVVGAPPFADFVAQRPFLVFGHLFDDEHLEIGTVALRRRLVFDELTRIGREHVEVVGSGVLHVARAVRLRGQRSVDLHHGLREFVIAAGGEKSLHSRELR